MNPQIVILGRLWRPMGGAGVAQARADVTVLDRTNHHLFSPLLYQVATAGLSAPAIAAPIRHILAGQRNTTVLLGEANAVLTDEKAVLLEDGAPAGHDYLIVATGAAHSYFGHDEWAPYAPGLKTLEDALEIRRRMLVAYERAERETDPVRRAAWLTFVVIGGGPTGVELAGQFAEIARRCAASSGASTRTARVVLVEGSDRILRAPPDLSEKAQLQLERLGVTTWVGRMVTNVDADGVSLGDERISAKTVVWAAGVAGSPLARSLGVPSIAPGA